MQWFPHHVNTWAARPSKMGAAQVKMYGFLIFFFFLIKRVATWSSELSLREEESEQLHGAHTLGRNFHWGPTFKQRWGLELHLITAHLRLDFDSRTVFVLFVGALTLRKCLMSSSLQLLICCQLSSSMSALSSALHTHTAHTRWRQVKMTNYARYCKCNKTFASKKPILYQYTWSISINMWC